MGVSSLMLRCSGFSNSHQSTSKHVAKLGLTQIRLAERLFLRRELGGHAEFTKELDVIRYAYRDKRNFMKLLAALT